MKRTAQSFLDDANRVSLLIDVLIAAANAEEALERAEAAGLDAVAEHARTRLVALLRRVEPEAALERLDQSTITNPLRLQSRIHAQLDLGRFEDARTAAASLGEATAEEQVLQARLAYLNDRDTALHWINRALKADDLHPETHVEALNLRARWVAETGDFAAGAEDFGTIMEMAKKHGALATVVLAQSYHTLYTNYADKLGMGALEMAEGIKQSLTAHLDIDLAKIGAIPPHVHALLLKFTGDDPKPGAYSTLLIQLASLMETGGQMEEAYVTLWYGASIGERIFGPGAVAMIRASLERLLARVGHERSVELADYGERRAAALLRLARPQDR